jgi:hypothetical protein
MERPRRRAPHRVALTDVAAPGEPPTTSIADDLERRNLQVRRSFDSRDR